jgi:hypothetical protein
MISRIEHRTNPVVLQDDELLASQRILLSIPQIEGRPYFHSIFSNEVKAQLGEVLVSALQLPADAERDTSRTDTFYANMQKNMADFAQQLLQHRLPYAERERRGMDEGIHVRAEAMVLDDYSSMLYPIPKNTHYTPEGDVINPEGALRQKLIFFRMKGMRGYIGGSDEASFGLYTNNLAAQSPRWEYNDHDGSATDMFPHNALRPHELNARPELTTNEHVAAEIAHRVARLFDQPFL